VDNIASHWPSLKRIPRNQARDVAALANSDLGDERKLARQFGARLRLGYSLPQDQRARRADIDGTQVLQRSGELAWPESPMAPDINSS
jgi:hypothetical protein